MDNPLNIPMLSAIGAVDQLVGCTFIHGQSTGAANLAVMGRYSVYIPRGVRNPKLVFTSFFSGAPETDFNVSIPYNVSYSPDEASPWDPERTYEIGEQCSYLATLAGSNHYTFTANVQNTNSRPIPTNTDWTATPRSQSQPVSFKNGQRAGTLSTVTQPDGSTVTEHTIVSDAIPITIPKRGFLNGHVWINNSSGLYPAPERPNNLFMGHMRQRGGSQADLTISTTTYAAADSAGHVFYPTAVIGTPLEDGPTVAMFGDSVPAGAVGGIGISSVSIVNGGSGYVVGELVGLNHAGMSAACMGEGGAFFGVVTAITAGGVISSVAIAFTGGYANPATTQTGQTLPTGTQQLLSLSGSGTGATCTITTTTSPMDIGDTYGCRGYGSRALRELNIPVMSMCRGGDRVNLYTSAGGARRRMALAKLLNCSTFVWALGNNDYTAGDSAATIKANLTKAAAYSRAHGALWVPTCTITPGTSSTTLAGQSTSGSQIVNTLANIEMQEVNRWMRVDAIQQGIFDQCIDVAAVVEEGGIVAPTGKWRTDLGVIMAPDGKHPSPFAMNLMKNVFKQAALQFK